MIKISIHSDNLPSQLIHIEYYIETPNAFKTLFFPTWRPGRYELADNLGRIKNLKIRDNQYKKTSPNEIELSKESYSLTLSFSFYASELNAGSSFVNEEVFYTNFINYVPFVKGQEHLQHEIILQGTNNKKIVCSLPFCRETNTLTAKSYYELIDSPLVISNKIQSDSYIIQNTEFFIHFWGNCTPPWEKIKKDFKAFSLAQIEIFGSFPSNEYHFIIFILPYTHYHGVEHKLSTVITLGKGDEAFNEKYDDLLGISSHELFHIYNVCRIRNQEMIPYDVSKPSYFETGFILEGLTTYYGDYILGKSHVFDQTQFFKEINLYLKRHFENFGRLEKSLAESSIDLWVDGYKNIAPDRKTSIYIEGALIAFITDIQIRKITANKKSLDDVMRLLYTRFGDEKTGYSSEDYLSILKEVSTKDFSLLYKTHVFGIEPLDDLLKEAMNYLGCELKTTPNENKAEKLFGFKTLTSHGKHKVVKIAPDSPAYFLLTLNDTIEVLDSNENSMTLLKSNKMNSKTNEIKSDGINYYNTYTIEVQENASHEQKMNLKNYLNQ